LGRTGSGRSGRIALYLLVLNMLALAVGLGMQYVEANRMPSVREFNPEKIRFWSQPTPYTRATASRIDPANPPVVAVPSDQAKPAGSPADRICLVVDDLSQDRFVDLQQLLKTNGLVGEQCDYVFDKKLAWWVFWPPEYEAARRTQVLEKIHAAGVKDVLPITQGPMAQAFSVGVFAFETQARSYRDSLRAKGLDQIQYGPRPSLGPVRIGCQLAAPRQEAFRAALPAWIKPDATEACTPP